MTANVDAMVNEAIRSFKAGKKSEARQLLEKATDLDQHHEKAWMWLSAVVESPEDQRICLENVLFINPGNSNARKGLDYLSQQMGDVTENDGDVIDDGFPDTNEAAAMFNDSSPPASSEPDSYTIPTSSSSASYDPRSQPTSDQYDDWVAGLNLASTQETVKASEPEQQFDFDDDLFADTFGTDEDSGMSDVHDTVSPFATSGSADDSLTSGPFDADSMLEGFSADDIAFEVDAAESDEAELDDLLADLDSGSPAAPSPVMSPAPPPSEQAAAVSRRKRRKTSKQATVPEKISTDEFYISGEDIDPDNPGEYFRLISSEIKPTVLPGQGGGGSVAVYAGLIVLVLANIGALAFLALNI